jgi:hypothetical protein
LQFSWAGNSGRAPAAPCPTIGVLLTLLPSAGMETSAAFSVFRKTALDGLAQLY